MAVLPHQFWLARPYSRISGIVLLMKLEKLVSLAYTPGWFAWAQPSPKLTTPACTQVPFTILQTRGPPESPWTDDTHTIKVLKGNILKAKYSMQVRVCKCLFVNEHRSTTSWSNSTWQESLPPSWYPAQIMSYRTSTCSFGFVRYISWHELWEMIGTCTSCRVPTPDRGTEENMRTEDEE